MITHFPAVDFNKTVIPQRFRWNTGFSDFLLKSEQPIFISGFCIKYSIWKFANVKITSFINFSSQFLSLTSSMMVGKNKEDRNLGRRSFKNDHEFAYNGFHRCEKNVVSLRVLRRERVAGRRQGPRYGTRHPKRLFSHVFSLWNIFHFRFSRWNSFNSNIKSSLWRFCHFDLEHTKLFQIETLKLVLWEFWGKSKVQNCSTEERWSKTLPKQKNRLNFSHIDEIRYMQLLCKTWSFLNDRRPN